jgi:phosphatidylglycerol lysyltransferase
MASGDDDPTTAVPPPSRHETDGSPADARDHRPANKAAAPRHGLLAAILRDGREAVAFQSLEGGLEVWTDAATGAVVPYCDTGGGWVAIGSPLAAEADVAEVAGRFSSVARSHGRRASWFGAEARIPGFKSLLVGEQPIWHVQRWPQVLARSRGLREQLRRARAAGVAVRAVPAAELRDGRPLRVAVDALATEWLARRPMEPMQFLVTLAPWHHPAAHRYFVAEQHGRLVSFLSLVPIPARNGWLLEDLLRGPNTPNGTSELMIDAAMRAVAAEGAELATMGLAPLSGEVGPALRLARAMGRGLYDFRGLRAFKQRLHPHAWMKVWLLVPQAGNLALGLVDVLRAFLGNRVARFVWRTILRHPSAICIALAAPLVPWTLFLLVLLALGAHGPLGFSRGALAAWAMFDAGLDVALWRAALRPRPVRLAALALLSSVDALLSVLRVHELGLGANAREMSVRLLATGAPVIATVALWAAAAHAYRTARVRGRAQKRTAAASRKNTPPIASLPKRTG